MCAYTYVHIHVYGYSHIHLQMFVYTYVLTWIHFYIVKKFSLTWLVLSSLFQFCSFISWDTFYYNLIILIKDNVYHPAFISLLSHINKLYTDMYTHRFKHTFMISWFSHIFLKFFWFNHNWLIPNIRCLALWLSSSPSFQFPSSTPPPFPPLPSHTQFPFHWPAHALCSASSAWEARIDYW